jgi:hypothetical protein
MKTTLDIDDQVLAEAKALATHQRTSLTRLIEEGLHLRLRARGATGRRTKLMLPLLVDLKRRVQTHVVAVANVGASECRTNYAFATP